MRATTQAQTQPCREHASTQFSRGAISAFVGSAAVMFRKQSAVLTGLLLAAVSVGAVYVSNLTPICLRCLCNAASACNLTLGCVDGFCGPFQVNRGYWRDAGRHVLPRDNPSRDGAFLDCVMDYACAQRVVEEYIIRFGADCNNDGVTDCDDFAMLHFNLKDDCKASVEGTNFGRRYSTCRPTIDSTEMEERSAHRHSHG